MLKNKVISKKSIYLTGINKFKINENLRKIRNDEVVVKIDSCGVCSSDLKFIYTGSRIKKYPIILGHEISGSIKNNTHIIFGAEIPCGKCNVCKNLRNNSNLCDNPISVGSNFDGGFSNYFIIKKRILLRTPHIIYKAKKKLKYAALAESLACVINGIEITNLKKQQNIAIIGVGYMGLLFVALSKIKNAKNICVIDFDQKRLQIAKKLGATKLVKLTNKNKNIVNNILKPTNNNGYNAVISANSNIKAHELACELVSKKGVINLFGGIPKNNNKLKLNSNLLHYKEAMITGSFSSNQKHLEKAFSLIKNKSIDFSQIVTSYVSYDNFKKKIRQLKNKKEIKLIFKP